MTVWKGQATIEVAGDGVLTVGGDLDNRGTIRLMAAPGLAGGFYRPIAVGGSWTGGGTHEAFGGRWDEIDGLFSVGAPVRTTSGQAVLVDLVVQQRVSMDDRLWLNFERPADASLYTTFITASVIEGSALDELRSILGPDASLEGCWDITTGLPTRAVLSFAVTGSPDADDVTIWHHDDVDGWTQYAPADLLVAGGWASFTVDGFSGYAVSVVPEPACCTVIGLVWVLLAQRSHRARYQ